MGFETILSLESRDLEDQVVIVTRELNSSTPQRLKDEFSDYDVIDLKVDLETEYESEERIIRGIRTGILLREAEDLSNIVGVNITIEKNNQKYTAKLEKQKQKQTYIKTGSDLKTVQYNPIKITVNREDLRNGNEAELADRLGRCLHEYEMRIKKQYKTFDPNIDKR